MEYHLSRISEVSNKGKTTVLFVLLLLVVLMPLTACSRSGTAEAAEAPGGQQRAIQNKGSDTLVNVALAWAEAYREIAPEVSIAVTGGGSGTPAIP